jgi:TetR/AcrR family transcriptional repressor of nem operon
MRLHGYHATSLDEVLRESGVGKGNFYHHFRSKEELGHAILDEIIQEFIEQTLDPCFSADAGDPLRQVRCFLDRIVEIHRRANCVGGCPLGNLASELSDVHEGFRARLAEIFSAWRERLTQVLTDARASGAIVAECAPEAVAQFIVASLEGGILLAKLTKDITVLEQCVGETSRYLRTYEVAG